MKKFAFILLVTFVTVSFASPEDLKSAEKETISSTVEEETPCSVVFTVCNTGFPDRFIEFEQCMVNNGCG